MKNLKKNFFLPQNKYFSQMIFLDTISSTQDYLKELAQSGQRGIICLAHHQTNGRGRAGRVWFCDAENLKFSMLFNLAIAPAFLPLISLVAGIAMKQTLEKLHGIAVQLKWPNDILIDGKKICGIISESATLGGVVQWIVCGIGVNTNMREQNMPKDLAAIATSLFIKTQKNIDEAELLEVFIGVFYSYLAMLENDEAKKIIEQYQLQCDTIGKNVKIIMDWETKFGVAKEVDEFGKIIVKTDAGLEAFSSADIVHLR